MVSATLIEKLEQLSPELQKKIEVEVDELLHQKRNFEEGPNFAEPQIKYGSMKGTVLYIADDFDAPVDDFKDYM
jgi:restriction endonuclease S subunit